MPTGAAEPQVNPNRSRFAKIEAFARSRRDRKKVEMLFAHLKRILRLARLRLRGPSGAQFEFTLAAIAKNLKRLAKLAPRPPERSCNPGYHCDATTKRKAMSEVRAGYHKYRAGSHFLFYRVTSGGVEVVRILHERMDFGWHLP